MASAVAVADRSVEEVPVVIGKSLGRIKSLGHKKRDTVGQPLAEEDRHTIARAVDAAEKFCGLQMLVYLGKTGSDTRQSAIALLQRQGYDTVPGVLVLVEPTQRRIEIVTSESAKARVSDETASDAIREMRPHLSEGNWVRALQVALGQIAQAAGAGEENPDEELPDFLE